MKKFYTLILLSFLFLTGFSQIPAGYYDNATGTGDVLKTQLYNIIKVQVKFSYDNVWDQLKYTDEDPDNTNNVILLYTGWSYPKSINGGGVTDWNREHTWAKSHGDFGTATGAGTDIHHLRPTDVTVNSARGNLHFDNGGTEYSDPTRYNQSGTFPTGCYSDGDTWEPRDEVKGDVARMIFYMATRYEGENGEPDLEVVDYIPANNNDPLHGLLSTLLQWHEQDPVSDWERRRNNRVFERQENRNPYIDHPEYVNRVFDPSADIQNKREAQITIYPNPTTNNRITISSGNNSEKQIIIYNLNGKIIKTDIFSSQNKEINLSDIVSGVYFVKIIMNKSISTNKIIIE